MPLPKPEEGESQSDFMNRCMHEAMKGTDDQDQGVAMCMDVWRKEKEREMDEKQEIRAFECRFEGENGPKIRGYPAVFGQMSEILGGFREQIAPGAFKKTLKERDVVALFNHNRDKVLGTTKAGTLTLREDKTGLYMEITPPDTADARDVMTLIERGDVNQGSFAFNVIKDSWDHEQKPPVRTLQEVALHDVSVVTEPAYSQTYVNLRSLMESLDARDTPVPEPEPLPEPEPVHSEEPAAPPPDAVKPRPFNLNMQAYRLQVAIQEGIENAS